ncbi:SRPBCC family protein [Caulobacter sp.]|uniref:SRPBCC family protein n=1 Tax=Caulobacter sp. TaxID=78 RepID=UPI002B4A5244|nr:SRPBCC family protein [Caulobacter sp.]HJV43321.1 SRPBCC family protein [Caulobacter sp.]
MFESRHISIRIHKPAAEVYAFAKDPESFPKWAAGLAAGLTRDGDRWIAHGPGGDVKVRFSPENPYGVLDHWVTLADGTELFIPLRVVANGEGAEVGLTLYRPPSMYDDAAFDRDAAAVARDLAKLKALLET